MKSILHPWQMLLLILAGWINQQQQSAIEYLIAENRVLRRRFWSAFIYQFAHYRLCQYLAEFPYPLVQRISL
jgi:hypothetical protein